MMEQVRSSTYKINSVILNRWSPRSMTGEANNFDVIAMVAIGKRDGKDNQDFRKAKCRVLESLWNK
jgi:hypothetical protein